MEDKCRDGEPAGDVAALVMLAVSVRDGGCSSGDGVKGGGGGRGGGHSDDGVRSGVGNVRDAGATELKVQIVSH